MHKRRPAEPDPERLSEQVATRLLTHPHVLEDQVSVLTTATPEGFAEGILSVIEDPARGRAIGERARQLAETKYSY